MKEGKGRVIDQMFAFIVIDGQGDEGLPAFTVGTMWAPMVGADMDRIESLMPQARDMAQRTGKTIRIYRFSVREQIGEVNP